MPIIRYRTGDLTEGVSAESCPCGRSSPKIKRILGRISDIPRIKGMFVAPRQVSQVLAKFKDLGRFQIIVDRPDIRDELTIRIEYRGKEKRKDLVEILISEFKAAIRLTAHVDLVEEGSISPDEPIVQDRRKVQ
jgi:phenylacetate-CoA ligase